MTHTIRKLAAALVLALLAPLAFAQGAFAPAMFTPFKKGGGSITSGSSIAPCTSSILYADASSLLKCDPAAVVNGSVSTAGRSILTIKDTITGASTTSNFLNVTGSFNGTLTAATSGALFSFTVDNDAQIQAGLKSIIDGVGPNYSAAMVGESNATGTISGGVVGYSTGAATFRYGGAFSLGAWTPSGVSGALLADNGSVASDIFRAMDNGIAVFTIADGGPVVVASEGVAGTLQLGVDVNGAAVNQTLKAHDGITGTNIKGASLTLAPGLGTGAAVSNPLTLNRVNTKATGTTAQTYSPAIVACPTKILSNTSATAQTIATITTTSTTGGNVTMDYTTVANNGTLQDTDSGMVKVSWNNNAGTVAATMSAVALQSDQDASGTLATTPTATVATNVVSIKFTPTWVTIVPTTVTGWALFHLATSGDTVVCQ